MYSFTLIRDTKSCKNKTRLVFVIDFSRVDATYCTRMNFSLLHKSHTTIHSLDKSIRRGTKLQKMSLFIFSGEVKYILRYHPSIYELLQYILENEYYKIR